jgi:hypothetical protein
MIKLIFIQVKSPLATKTSTLSAVGAKKPLTVVKKSPGTEVSKKLPATNKTTTVKKTTTTTVTKKVVNGDIVEQSTNVTVQTSGDLIPELNGHVNGNGLMENGAGEITQQSDAPDVSVI